MSYQVFARKYRPQDFDSVVGQEHITQTLKNAIAQNRLAHAYLFVGPRGVGKTSTARILAKALNCVKGPTIHPCGECDVCREISQGISLDVLEIDGASNNGVEQVRELRENVRFAPTRGQYKIYIIDEVHMLTSAAFNALLKTLEEPPEHVKFIFATTEPQKVLPTILSRCQRFDLRRIPGHLIAQHLKYIASNESVVLSDAAAEAIAKGAEGGLRDAESMLDQLVAFCGESIEETDVLSIFGFTALQTVSDLCGAILNGDSPQALALVHQQAEAGKELSILMADLISHLRNLLIAKADPGGLKDELGEEALATLRAQAESIAMERLLELIEQFAAAEGRMKWAPNKKLHFEIAVIKAIQTLGQATLNEVIDTLTAIRTGKEPPAPPARPVLPVAKAAPLPRSATPPAQTAPARPTPPPTPVAASAPAPIPEPRAVVQPAPEPPKPELFPEPPAPEPPNVSSVSLDREAIWKAMLTAVRAKRGLISPWLESGLLTRIDEESCVIAFPKEQALAMESISRPTHRTYLEGLLQEITGQKLKIRCEMQAGLVVVPPTLPERKVEAPVDPMEDFKNDPLIQKALEIFKGEIQPA